MHRFMRIPVSMVILATVGCAPSSPSRPPAATRSDYAARVAAGPWSRLKSGGLSARGVKAAAVINGFRVHPDPGDDGVIRVAEGENVVVNATDIASRPPAPPSYLVVNWGDGPNQRVGCGPCRMDHSYGRGRYTLVASADGLPEERSISVTVEVSGPPREKRRPSRFEFFGIVPEQMPVGANGRIVLPFYEPPGVILYDFDILCEPLDIIEPSGPVEFVEPDYVALPFLTTGPGTCTLFIYGEDANGEFTETSTLTIE
jgi:hypothetical protein